jgi:hypothetical protein
MKVRIEEVEVSDSWDQELENFNGSIFLSNSWLRTIAADAGQLVFFRFLQDKEIEGLLGGMIIPYKKGMKQLFFYSGPALKNPNPITVQHCLQALYQYAAQHGYVRIILKSYDFRIPDTPPATGFHAGFRHEYFFDLANGPEEVVRKFHPEVRRLARKAEKSGVTIHESKSAEFVDSLMAMLKETHRIRQEKGYGAYVYMFLPFLTDKKIKDLLLQQKAFLLYATQLKKIISIQLILHNSRSAYGLLMGNCNEAYKTGTPSLLFRDGLNILHEKGIRFYNIGGVQQSKSHSGLGRFKDKLHPENLTTAELETDFIRMPFKLFNPLLALKRHLENGSRLPWIVRKQIIDWIKRGVI